MTIEELVRSLNIAEDQRQAANDAIKKFLDGDFVPKARFNEINEEKKTLAEQVKTRDQQIKDLKKNNGDNEDLKKQIEELEKANKIQKQEAEAKMKEFQLNSAIQLAIQGTAQDVDIVSSLFDKSKLILSEDGKVTGLQEQLDALKKDKAFLFKTEKTPHFPAPNGGNSTPTTVNPFKKETFNLTEQGRMLRDHPEQARAMAAEAGVTLSV